MKKFNELGYVFDQQGPNYKFYRNGEIIAEADYWLENGDYVMAVEVKTEPSTDDINEHLKRIEIIRKCMDKRRDGRKIVGCVAGGIYAKNVLEYVQKMGLYALVLSGERFKIADMPPWFKAREW